MAGFRPVLASSPPPGRPVRDQGLAGGAVALGGDKSSEIDSEKANQSDIDAREASKYQN